MKRDDKAADAAAKDVPAGAAAAPTGDAAAPEAAPIADSAAAEGEVLFDPAHEWPSSGGCYVRQGDGTLKRED